MAKIMNNDSFEAEKTPASGEKRLEKDSMGPLEVPINALYGAQTQRAINNFTVSSLTLPEDFIRALLLIKQSAADTNVKLELIPQDIGDAISTAVDKLLGMPDLMQHFPVDVFQTGSGTSTNMNANEVLSRLANQAGGLSDVVDANDHVNFGQSSNDVIPTCIHVSAVISIHHNLLPALEHIVKVIEHKADSLGEICKTGRTHLMDAMPITLQQVLSGWAAQLSQQIQFLIQLQANLQQLAIGGTAVGTGINTHPKFAQGVCKYLSTHTGMAFRPNTNYFAAIASQDTAVNLSGVLKTIAVAVMKISNDLRWMNSGPLAGLGEIALPALQPGSSIMPGKVNPVVPEASAMASAQVIGNDAAIVIGGQSGNFELNVMLPMIAHNLLSSITLMSNSLNMLANKAIKGFSVNQDSLNKALDKNPILVTALNPVIGYAKAAEVAKKAYREKRPVVDVAQEMTDIPREELLSLLNPLKLTKGGL
jgi:fumarate hydratase class II